MSHAGPIPTPGEIAAPVNAVRSGAGRVTSGSAWVMGTGYRSVRCGPYRVPLAVGRFGREGAGDRSVAVGLVPDLPARGRVPAEVLKLDLDRAPGCSVVIRDSA